MISGEFGALSKYLSWVSFRLGIKLLLFDKTNKLGVKLLLFGQTSMRPCLGAGYRSPIRFSWPLA